MAYYETKRSISASSNPGTKARSDANVSESPPVFWTIFASLSLHQFDRIRLLKFPPEVTDLVRQAIQRSWRGIQSERVYGGSYEFKLLGNPWYGSGEEAMTSRRLMQHILASLWNAGWLMSLSTDVSKKQMDKDTLIFRQQMPPPPPCDWISISFSRSDRVRIMDAPQDLIDAIVAELRPLTQDSGRHSDSIWEIKIRGYPWMATGEETMTARMILLQLIAVLERFGFTVYASIDQKATREDNRSESDTWHCRRLQSWTPGAPIFHQ